MHYGVISTLQYNILVSSYIVIKKYSNLLLCIAGKLISISVCKTVGERFCDFPFEFEGKKYSTCINVDNGGRAWCFTNSTTMEWDSCDTSSCASLKGRFKDYTLACMA